MINFSRPSKGEGCKNPKEPEGGWKGWQRRILSPVSNRDAYLWLTLSDISHIPVGWGGGIIWLNPRWITGIYKHVVTRLVIQQFTEYLSQEKSIKVLIATKEYWFTDFLIPGPLNQFMSLNQTSRLESNNLYLKNLFLWKKVFLKDVSLRE